LFGFDEMDGSNQYLPHNHVRNCVVYTGTHDNNTVRGWFEKEAGKRVRDFAGDYVGKKLCGSSVGRDFVRMAMESVGKIAIFPIQDAFGIGSEGRMNKPSTVRGNWRWRCGEDLIKGQGARDLKRLCELSGRV
jgi:4-alpha-glucanotransferase